MGLQHRQAPAIRFFPTTHWDWSPWFWEPSQNTPGPTIWSSPCTLKFPLLKHGCRVDHRADPQGCRGQALSWCRRQGCDSWEVVVPLSKWSPGSLHLTGLHRVRAVPVFQKSMGQPAIPIAISVGVVPARKRSRETRSGDPGPWLVGLIGPLSFGEVSPALVILWRNVVGSDLPLPTPPVCVVLRLVWKTVWFLLAQKSVPVRGSRLSEPLLALHS